MCSINTNGDVPLTTEELAVLVAINPENEMLYQNVGQSDLSALVANGNGSGAANESVETAETAEMVDDVSVY